MIKLCSQVLTTSLGFIGDLFFNIFFINFFSFLFQGIGNYYFLALFQWYNHEFVLCFFKFNNYTLTSFFTLEKKNQNAAKRKPSI